MSMQMIPRAHVWGAIMLFTSSILCGAAIAQDKATKPEPEKAAVASKEGAEPALMGYCPVSYFTDGKPVKGDPKYRSEYEGFVYFFADAEKKATFDKDPAKYAPRLGGLCAVALGGPYGNRFYGDPTVFAMVGGKLYLMSSARAKASFDQRPEHYTERAEEIYRTPAINGFCPVKYQTDNAAAPGESQYLGYYHGFAYALSSAEAAEKFKKDPAKYAPAFDGYGALGVSKGQQHPGNPKIFAVVDGRTYLFFDQAAKEECLNREPSCIAEAEQNWPNIARQLYRIPGR